jgi:sulfate transport system substrate-binding protein
VLVTFENEAALIKNEVDGANFEVVYPSLSIEAAPPVALVTTVTQKRGSQTAAKAYFDFLYTEDAQALIAKHNFRPRSDAVLKANAARFPQIKTFRTEDKLGQWADLQKAHFTDGGIYDQITAKQN